MPAVQKLRGQAAKEGAPKKKSSKRKAASSDDEEDNDGTGDTSAAVLSHPLAPRCIGMVHLVLLEQDSPAVCKPGLADRLDGFSCSVLLQDWPCKTCLHIFVAPLMVGTLYQSAKPDIIAQNTARMCMAMWCAWDKGRGGGQFEGHYGRLIVLCNTATCCHCREYFVSRPSHLFL